MADQIRVLFCIGVREAFFAAGDEERTHVLEACRTAFEDLGGRFGLQVLGTMDDDEVQVGPSDGFPWTCYILADAPDYRAVSAVCSILREHPVGAARLWRYLTVEARLGRPLFFGDR
jgi:hypothetical protein